jgi:hypothetical protein
MRRLALAVLGTIAVLGCTSKEPTGIIDADFVGTYTLRTIATYALPYAVLQRQDFRLEITADTITLGANGSYTDYTHYRRINGLLIDFPADTLLGTWTTVGSTVKIETTKGSTIFGEIASSTMTIDPLGIPFVYQK